MYEHDDEPQYNENGERIWPGFEWAQPPTHQARDAMCEALLGDDDGDGEPPMTDEEKVAALLEYLADPKHGYETDETDYTARELAAMFEARCVEYEGWYEVGANYLNDHYSGIIDDPLACMHTEDVQQVGANVGGSEHEEERYLWVEADDGRVFCIVRPTHVEKDGARK